MTDLRQAAQQALEALKDDQYRMVETSEGHWEYKTDLAIAALEAALRAALAQHPEPVTIERLRDALVASRIIPPAAVEDPDEYDDGVTLYRIEALHRRIT